LILSEKVPTFSLKRTHPPRGGVYDEAKRFEEALAMAYHRAHGVDVRI